MDIIERLAEVMSNVEVEENTIQLDENVIQQVNYFKLNERDYFWLVEQIQKIDCGETNKRNGEMKIMSKSREDLWNDIQSLTFDVKRLGGIVQNEGEIFADEMNEWIFSLEETVNKLDQIREDMLTYYIRQDEPV